MRDEIARLRAELDALKPKPVIRVLYAWFRVGYAMEYGSNQNERSNLKLTLHDGKPVSAEVITTGESK